MWATPMKGKGGARTVSGTECLSSRRARPSARRSEKWRGRGLRREHLCVCPRDPAGRFRKGLIGEIDAKGNEEVRDCSFGARQVEDAVTGKCSVEDCNRVLLEFDCLQVGIRVDLVERDGRCRSHTPPNPSAWVASSATRTP